MIKNILGIALLSLSSLLLGAAPAIVDRGRDWNKWQWEVSEERNGAQITRLASFIELGSGFNYFDGNQWVSSSEDIEVQGNEAVASKGPHKVKFQSNINRAGAIQLWTTSGKKLRSHPLALAMRDGSGARVVFATIKDSIGQLSGSNQIIYPNAFSGIEADIRYVYTRGGFEQDILLHEIINPEDYQLDPGSAVLEIITEFIEFPTPKLKKKQYKAQGVQWNDEELTFDDMMMVEGRGFLLGGTCGRR